METDVKNNTSSSIGPLDFFDSPSPDIIDSEEAGKHSRRRMVEGESALLLAVLEDAVNCYLKNLSAKDRIGKRNFDEAEEWIFGDEDGDWLFSFKNICENLGIAPAYIRHGLLERKKQPESHSRACDKVMLERKRA